MVSLWPYEVGGGDLGSYGVGGRRMVSLWLYEVGGGDLASYGVGER